MSANHRRTRLIASTAGMALAAILTLAPAAGAATPMELCPLEQGPDGLQCQKPPTVVPNFEVCDLEQGPNGLQCKKPGFEKPDFEICDLEQGPNGVQCVDEVDPEDPGPEEPPVDPEPEPQPEPEPETDGGSNTGKAPQGGQSSGTDTSANGALQVASGAGADAPQVAIEAPAAVEAPESDTSYALPIGLAALVAAGAIFAFGRRRRTDDDAAGTLSRM